MVDCPSRLPSLQSIFSHSISRESRSPSSPNFALSIILTLITESHIYFFGMQRCQRKWIPPKAKRAEAVGKILVPNPGTILLLLRM